MFERIIGSVSGPSPILTKIVLVIGLDLKPLLEAIFWNRVTKKVELWPIFYKNKENLKNTLWAMKCIERVDLEKSCMYNNFSPNVRLR